MKRLAIAAFVWLTPATALAQYCPCYTLSSSSNTHNCGIEAVAGTNPSVAEWQDIFALVAQGPAVWGNAGPTLGDIGQGCGNPEPLHQVPARFPCEILKSIAMQESGWRQFCVPTTPSDQVGGASRTIISFDCGYGIGQVTSGMHVGESPNFDRARVASDPTYNLATGTQILASKWRATNCVGDNQPSIVEDWYTAAWAYNGLAYSNNPSNPTYSASRGVWNPSVGGSAPYQEKVFGWTEFPTGSPPRWQSVALAYPNIAEVGGSGSPPALSEPSCASPTDCNNTRSVHVSYCFGTGGSGGTGGTGGTGGGASGGTGGTATGGTGGSATGGTGGSATGGTGATGTGGSGASTGGSSTGATTGWADSGVGATGAATGTGGAGASYGQQSHVIGGDDSGCACRAAGTGPRTGWLALAFAGLLAGATRRRRSSRAK